jgi:tRNA(Arg) A34 adenosine deaminase TadA
MLNHHEAAGLLIQRAEQLVSHNRPPVVAIAVFEPHHDVIEEAGGETHSAGLHVFAAIAARLRQRRSYTMSAERWDVTHVTVFATHKPCQTCVLDMQEAGVHAVITGSCLEPTQPATATVFDVFTNGALGVLDTQLETLQAQFAAVSTPTAGIEHRQSQLANGTLVDTNIVALLNFLHAHGCATEYSCEGGPASWDKPYILFADLSSFETGIAALRSLAVLNEREDLAERIDNAHPAEDVPSEDDAVTWALAMAPWERRLRGHVSMPLQDRVDLDALASSWANQHFTNNTRYQASDSTSHAG